MSISQAEATARLSMKDSMQKNSLNENEEALATDVAVNFSDRALNLSIFFALQTSQDCVHIAGQTIRIIQEQAKPFISKQVTRNVKSTAS